MYNKSNVRLPEWIWETADNTDHLKDLIRAYVDKRYPGYRVVKVKGRIAICDIGR
ncbi:hypothetical protein [Oceanobacillus alkalisoli]|uniref:hypothetical protein n=1 Tax=Oceanobacillus alkalisoli TaxID=2925113 RepID=UPI001EE47CE7|nr:hypothetical protein [Oceanobacillus alkalisoli]MCG5104409.1 hypothetical protein [Oceanobacillus alkalisoli]